MRLPPAPPQSEAELLRRAYALSGHRIDSLARRWERTLPPHLKRDKGWLGTFFEHVLGADSRSKARPDFSQIGVEMKTIPLRPDGRPHESTYVCVAPIDRAWPERWQQTWLHNKLRRVLWLPIVFEKHTPLAERVVGPPLLWSPSEEEDQQLQADWRQLGSLIAQGNWAALNARVGQSLQLRPKAASARELVWVIGADGDWVRENPRGFYLRSRFTARLFKPLFEPIHP